MTALSAVTGGATLAVALSTSPIVTGQYYHLVGTYDGPHVRLYVNGMLEGQAAVSATIDYGTRPVFIGTSGEAFDGKLNGVVDEATIYNRALDAVDVTMLYAASSAGKCASPTGLLASLAQFVQNLNLSAGIAASFDAKLSTALAALDDAKAGNTVSVCNRLQAFMNEVAAQSGGALTIDQAAQLTSSAHRISPLSIRAMTHPSQRGLRRPGAVPPRGRAWRIERLQEPRPVDGRAAAAEVDRQGSSHGRLTHDYESVMLSW